MKKNISVCMATYNGEKYIKQQLESILSQLENEDEIIIIDDCSTDNTFKILSSYSDSRIKLFKNEKNMRHVKTFGKAMGLAQNELVMLVDQDDIWSENRVTIFKQTFIENSKIELITSNFYCIDGQGNAIDNTLSKVSPEDSEKYKKNIKSIFLGKIGYFGCAMAFKKELLTIILPIPNYIEAHDLWIAMIANVRRTNFHIRDKTLYHRMHGSNASDLKRKLTVKILARVHLAKAYFTIRSRNNAYIQK